MDEIAGDAVPVPSLNTGATILRGVGRVHLPIRGDRVEGMAGEKGPTFKKRERRKVDLAS